MFDHAYHGYQRKRGSQVPAGVLPLVIGALIVAAIFLLLWRTP